MAIKDKRRNPRRCQVEGCAEQAEFWCDVCGAARCGWHNGPDISTGGDACYPACRPLPTGTGG